MRIAVAGATGLVGGHLVRELSERRHDTVLLARSTGVDLVRGTGLDGRLEGVDGIVDVTNVTTSSRARSISFFDAVSTRLLDAVTAAGVGHYVALSIVGIDGVDLGYYRGKLRQEELVAESSAPWTILRATQFHEFAGQMLDRMSVGPVGVLPRMRVQPIAVREVASALADRVLGPPAGRAPDLAGPAREELVDMARRLARRRGRPRVVVGTRVPGAGGRALVDGGLLPRGDAVVRGPSFSQWLADEGGSG